MKKPLFIIIFLLFNITYSICQEKEAINKVYDFLENVIFPDDTKEYILSEPGSGRLLLDENYLLNFNPSSCFFNEKKYDSWSYWDVNLTQKDYEYITNQIVEFKNHKWSKKYLPTNIILYNSKQVKEYSKNAEKNEQKMKKGKQNENFEVKLIYFCSIPVFNEDEDLAFIYFSTYSGPFSKNSAVSFRKDSQN